MTKPKNNASKPAPTKNTSRKEPIKTAQTKSSKTAKPAQFNKQTSSKSNAENSAQASMNRVKNFQANDQATRFPFAIPSREDILAVLRQAKTPLTALSVGQMLGVNEDSQEGFDRRLSAMERDGQLMQNRKGVLLLATKLDFIAGKVVGHREGFGFLIRDEAGPDIYLSSREMSKILHGDRVLVRIIGTDRKGRPEGSIVEVLERRTKKLVGRFLSERGVFIVAPEDQRVKHDILIPPGEVGTAMPGQVVSVEIIQQPSRYAPPMGKIVEVLGAIDDPGMEIEIAVRKFNVPHEFTENALADTAKLPDEVQVADLKGRVDLRDIPFVTIDGEDARDFDDAVYCEPIEGGGFRLLVAIADVSHYVASNSALDHDAQERSTSVYFPRRVIPMLPEKISNGLCSLNPQVDRLALVCDMVIGSRGALKSYQFYPAVIYSHARLTYTEVWNMLSEADPITARKNAKILPYLQNLHELYKILLDARGRRGAIDFDTTETYIVCNELGRIEKIIPRVRNDAHKLIEECMLAANVCAADFLERSKHGGLYRIHEGPTPDKLQALREFLKTLGLHLDGGSEPSAKDYQALMKRIQGRTDTQVLQTMLLRSMQQAIYSPDNVGHFGLSYKAYAHFTSPIRRYPDLLTHRVIKSLLQTKTYIPPNASQDADPYDKQPYHSAWEKLGVLCSANERRADDASRDVQAWLKCFFMKEKEGECFAGTVSSVAPFGAFVTLNDLFVDGLIHVSELGDEYFQYNETTNELRGEHSGKRFKIGDAVHVQVSRVDIEARKIEFRLVKTHSYKQIISGALNEKPSTGKVGIGKKAAPDSPQKREAREARRSERSNTSRRSKSKKTTTQRSSSQPVAQLGGEGGKARRKSSRRR